MYEVIFYRDKNGRSDIVDYLDELGAKAHKSKSDRINREKILAYIGALSECGTRIGEPMVKHIGEGIWELRPLRNRILFFCWADGKFVLLSHFVKKTQKTPLRELARAKRRMKDFMERSSGR